MTETRVERKERTRRAILDAALELCEREPLAALSLRQVAKQVGIVPTAFYRHFESIDELGLALVDESFSSLRDLLKAARPSTHPPRAIEHSSWPSPTTPSMRWCHTCRRPTGTSGSSRASG